MLIRQLDHVIPTLALEGELTSSSKIFTVPPEVQVVDMGPFLTAVSACNKSSTLCSSATLFPISVKDPIFQLVQEVMDST